MTLCSVFQFDNVMGSGTEVSTPQVHPDCKQRLSRISRPLETAPKTPCRQRPGELTPAEREAKHHLQNAGFVYLGVGAGRIVFQIPPQQIRGATPCVVKLARHPHDGKEDGQRQNRTEHRIWESASGDLRRALVPLYEIGDGGRWLVRRYARDLDDPTRIAHLEQQLATHRQIPVHEINPPNVGIVDETPRLRDYGVLYTPAGAERHRPKR